MSEQNLTPAQAKAVENGGTNNAVIGRSLVKKGIFEETPSGAFKFSPVPVKDVEDVVFPEPAHAAGTSLANAIDLSGEKHYADAIEAEEREADKTAPAFESWQIEQWNTEERERTIEALRNEFEDADDERREEIRNELARMGTVVYPEGSPQHTEYTEKLRAALAEWRGDAEAAFADQYPKAVGSVHIDDVPGQGNTDAEVRFAEAVDADDMEAQREILNETAPAVVVRDPNEKRYAHVGSWTDENLFIKEEILSRRLNRRTLLLADRKQAERHLRTVKDEIAARGL